MEHNQSTLRYRGVSRTPTVLIAGFPKDEARGIVEALEKMAWTTTVLCAKSQVEESFAKTSFNITAIDTENLEGFAPEFIGGLRSTRRPSGGATILAINDSSSAATKEQLIQAGADLVIPRPSDPRMYVIDFTQAATLRLKKIGQTHA